jgi:deazaflavin-dependent oxidoreductase (nitroreductase family)
VSHDAVLVVAPALVLLGVAQLAGVLALILAPSTSTSEGELRSERCGTRAARIQHSAGSVPSMTLEGEYEASPWDWVQEQVEAYERTGGREANTLRDTGLPIIIVTTRGNKSGKLRKTPLMRVEHEGAYALVASMGGAPKHPVWYFNLKADPQSVAIQDGPEPFDVDVRELDGDERAEWWERAVAAYPPYAEYQTRTERRIPVFVATRRS